MISPEYVPSASVVQLLSAAAGTATALPSGSVSVMLESLVFGARPVRTYVTPSSGVKLGLVAAPSAAGASAVSVGSAGVDSTGVDSSAGVVSAGVVSAGVVSVGVVDSVGVAVSVATGVVSAGLVGGVVVAA